MDHFQTDLKLHILTLVTTEQKKKLLDKLQPLPTQHQTYREASPVLYSIPHKLVEYQQRNI